MAFKPFPGGTKQRAHCFACGRAEVTGAGSTRRKLALYWRFCTEVRHSGRGGGACWREGGTPLSRLPESHSTGNRTWQWVVLLFRGMVPHRLSSRNKVKG